MRLSLLISVLQFVVAAGVLTAWAAAPASPQESSGSRSGSAPVAAETLPPDVYPDSRNRLPQLKREELDEVGKKVFDAAGNAGTTGIRLHSPVLADSMNTVNDYLRRKAGIEPRLAEVTILVATRGMDAQYEWTVHELAARRVGLEQEIIDIIKYRKPLTGLGEKEAAIIQLGREAFSKESVSPDTFARALNVFGKQGLVNVVSLMSHYAGTTVLMKTFGQQLPLGQKPLLPLP